MKIGIFFGVNSREREVSFAGGRTVYDNLDKTLFEAIPIFVDSFNNFILLDWHFIYKGSIRDFYLNPMGELYTPRLVTEYHYHRYVYGTFSTANNVTFTLQSGGLGSNQTIEVFGKRIKNG